MELKKIINQDIKTKKGKGKKKISFLAGCIVGDELYFSSWIDRGFYKMNLQTGQCIPLSVFGKEIENMLLYSQAVYFENTIWLIPAYGQNIAKVNLETLEIEYLDLPRNGKEILGKNGIRYSKFKCCYKEGTSELWLAPIGYNMFLKVDMRTNQITEYSELRKKLIFEDGFIYFSDACLIEDKVWLCPWDGEELVIFDTKSGKFQFHKWEYAEANYRIVRNYKNQAIFLSQTAPRDILLLNYDTYKERKIPIDVTWENKSDLMYLVADVIGKQLFLAPFQANEYVLIDLENGKIQADTKFHEYSEDRSWVPERYQTSIRCGSKIIYTSDSKNIPLMILDLDMHTVSYLEKVIEKDTYRNFLTELRKKDKRVFFKYINKNEESIILEEDVPLNMYYSEPDILTDKIYNMDVQKTIGEKILSNVR